MLTLILFVIWFVFLVKWADLLVWWASSVALKFWISPLVIWLTIVAFWTSAPELVVNVLSAISWKTDLAVWNILWSNIANTLLVLWITAIIVPLTAKKSTVRKEIPYSLFCSVLLLIIANDVFLHNTDANVISRVDWLILMFFLSLFLLYIFKVSQESKIHKNRWKNKIEEISTWKSAILILIWLIWLTVWGNWIVNWATMIAEFFWMSEAIIGLTVVAIWTSLPELATSVVAALKWENDIAIWNIVWSNILNIVWILWVTSIITPININYNANSDILMVIFSTILLILFVFIWKKQQIEKRQWATMLWIYILYIAYLIISSL